MAAGYLYKAINLQQRRRIIRDLLKLLRGHNGEFEAIAFRGMSGCLIAPIICDTLKKQLFLVRKPIPPGATRGHHSYNKVEWSRHGADQYDPQEHPNPELKWIILDDQVSTGTTKKEIIEHMMGEGFPKPIAIVTYNYGTYWKDLP